MSNTLPAQFDTPLIQPASSMKLAHARHEKSSSLPSEIK
jgi:hypothetical protein